MAPYKKLYIDIEDLETGRMPIVIEVPDNVYYESFKAGVIAVLEKLKEYGIYYTIEEKEVE